MFWDSERTENTHISDKSDPWRYRDSCGTGEPVDYSGFRATPRREYFPADDERNKAGRPLQLQLQLRPKVRCSVEQPVRAVPGRRENAARFGQAWLGFPR